jgi:ATPase subunit of ABC transporter with duplicated ATPase domains
MSLIRLHNVTVKYEDHSVLRSVFFKLQSGERIGQTVDLAAVICHDEQTRR